MGAKTKKVGPEERLTALENSVTSAMAGFSELKKMLGTEAVDKLVKRVDSLETMFNTLIHSEIKQLLGELRAVRHLLDEKKQYLTMDVPAKKSDQPPVPERVF